MKELLGKKCIGITPVLIVVIVMESIFLPRASFASNDTLTTSARIEKLAKMSHVAEKWENLAWTLGPGLIFTFIGGSVSAFSTSSSGTSNPATTMGNTFALLGIVFVGGGIYQFFMPTMIEQDYMKLKQLTGAADEIEKIREDFSYKILQDRSNESVMTRSYWGIAMALVSVAIFSGASSIGLTSLLGIFPAWYSYEKLMKASPVEEEFLMAKAQKKNRNYPQLKLLKSNP